MRGRISTIHAVNRGVCPSAVVGRCLSPIRMIASMPSPARFAIGAILSTLPVVDLLAEVRLPHLFSDGMILQRDRPVPIWGWADRAEPVTVRIAGQELGAVADERGEWSITLQPLAVGKPLEMQITGSHGPSLVVRDVLVGDVFQCSGQSNMAMTMESARRAPGVPAEITETDIPEVRFFQAPWGVFADHPAPDVMATWKPLGPAANAGMAAVPFYIATSLYRHLHVPIGIIRASHAGGPIEAKMPLEALRLVPSGKAFIDRSVARAANRKATGAETTGPDGLPPTPAADSGINGAYPAADWNGSIAPVIRYGKRGIVWYQGEHNAGSTTYGALLESLITSWRTACSDPSMPFVIIQLPRYGHPDADGWPILRVAQAEVANRVPGTGLVVTIDTGEADNIHPADKRVVGERAALELRHLAYGEDVRGCGPLVDRALSTPRGIEVEFTGVHQRLVTKLGGSVADIEVADEKGVYSPANARVDGQRLLIPSPAVPHPTAVRYGWKRFPSADLMDDGGLPVAPFRIALGDPPGGRDIASPHPAP